MEVQENAPQVLPGVPCVVITGDPVAGEKFSAAAQKLFEDWRKQHLLDKIRSFSFRPTWPDDNGNSNGNSQLVTPAVIINYIPAPTNRHYEY